jgi:hypothetical protein
MNGEQQRIKIAEACGWHNIRPNPIGATPLAGNKEAVPFDGALFGIPDYLNDLNAMHEAEKRLPLSKGTMWLKELDRVCGVPDDEDEWTCALVVAAHRATAAQRAEAFLRATNLWEEV